MSSATKTILALVALIIVVLAGWTWYELSQPSVPTAASTVPVTDNSVSAAPAQPAASAAPAGMSAPNDTSDAAINQDVTSLDAQLGGLNTDSSNLSTQ